MFTGRNARLAHKKNTGYKKSLSTNHMQRYHSRKTNTPGLISRFCTFFANAYNGSNNTGINHHYHGPSYRATAIQNDLVSMTNFIKNGGLKNNCKPGQEIINYSVTSYVDLNLPSPMFGGCYTLHDAVRYAKENNYHDDCIIYLIASTQPGEQRKKIYANLAYYVYSGESNPRAHENEIIHLGDFSDLAYAAITIGDARTLLNKDGSLNDEIILCRLTGNPVNISAWHKNQIELARKAEAEAESASRLTRE